MLVTSNETAEAGELVSVDGPATKVLLYAEIHGSQTM